MPLSLCPDTRALSRMAVIVAGALAAAPLAAQNTPAPWQDPYRAALDAREARQTDLMKAERMTGRLNERTLDGNGYDPLPPTARGPRAGLPAAEAGNAPQETAQAVYLESLKGPKTNAGGQQVYRMPW